MKLTAVERISTGRGRELGAQLRGLRERAGYSGVELANILGWSPSKLSRMEAGKSGIDDLDVVNFAAHCEAKPRTIADLMTIVKEPRDGQRLKPHEDGLPDQLHSFMFHERTATRICDYEPIYIPGLAQTEGYMRALFREGGEPEALFDRWTEARLGRQNVLRGPNAPDCLFLVHENALRMRVGSAEIMHEQLLNLIFLTSRPQISVRVIPCSAGPRGLASGAFQIFTYGEGGPVVYVQHETTSEFLEKKQDIDHYRRTLNRVASVALDESHSGALLATLASELERQGERHDDSDRPAGDELAEE